MLSGTRHSEIPFTASKAAVALDSYIHKGEQFLYADLDDLTKTFGEEILPTFQGFVPPTVYLFLKEIANWKKDESKKIGSKLELETELTGWYERLSRSRSLSRDEPEELESLEELRDFCIQVSVQFSRYNSFIRPSKQGHPFRRLVQA